VARPDDSSLDAMRLHAPLARLLRPLVRLFIRTGITFPALSQLLRELYINVAEYDFALPDKAQTDSRVSLLTGIHRKEVSKLRGAGAPIHNTPATLSWSSRIIAHWLAAPAYTDALGAPRPLPRSGEAPSFEALVASITKDLRPRAVLDEWLDRNLVSIDENGFIRLEEKAFLPQAGSEQQLYYFGRNLHDHIAASVENIVGQAPVFFERAVHYDDLSAPLAARLEARSRDLAMNVLQDANREAHAAYEEAPGGDWRWTFGIYIYREKVKPEPQEDSGKDAS